MGQLTIAWEYLTGCCVATNVADRQRAEWPPHPARVFMALAAAWFETGEDETEGLALRWLEALGDPELLLPSNHDVFPRNVIDVYVPVNDKAGPSKAVLQSAPSLTRDRQPRTFPSTWVGDAVCYARWQNVDDAQEHSVPLNRLCSKVTRIGHSSSLVRMWVAHEIISPQTTVTWVPDEGLAEYHARHVSDGILDLLDRQFNAKPRHRFQQLERELADLDSQENSLKEHRERLRQQVKT